MVLLLNLFLCMLLKRGEKKCHFSRDNTEQTKTLLTVVRLMKTFSPHHPIVKHWLIVIKEHILISKPIVILVTHRPLSYKYMKHLLMHKTVNFCFGVTVQYQIQTSKKKHANHNH